MASVVAPPRTIAATLSPACRSGASTGIPRHLIHILTLVLLPALVALLPGVTAAQTEIFNPTSATGSVSATMGGESDSDAFNGIGGLQSGSADAGHTSGDYTSADASLSVTDVADDRVQRISTSTNLFLRYGDVEAGSADLSMTFEFDVTMPTAFELDLDVSSTNSTTTSATGTAQASLTFQLVRVEDAQGQNDGTTIFLVGVPPGEDSPDPVEGELQEGSYRYTVVGDVSNTATGSKDNTASTSGTQYLYFYEAERYEQDILTANDGASGDEFGRAIDADGNVAVVGNPEDDCADGAGCGSAYVYHRQNDAWTQETKLQLASRAAGDEFGASVAVDGDVIAVGAPDQDGTQTNEGFVHVYRWDGNTWQHEAQLKGTDTDQFDTFGFDVAIDDDVIVASAPGRSPEAAYVFRWNGSSWTEEATLTSGTTSDVFYGQDVDLSTGVLIVAAPVAEEAYVYRYDAGTGQWPLEATIVNTDPANHRDFGQAAAVDGDVLMVSGYADSGPVEETGMFVDVYRWDGGAWQGPVYLQNSQNGINSFGRRAGTVDLDGDRAWIGATDNSRGGAYLFEYDTDSDTWLQTYFFNESQDSGTWIPRAVALAGPVGFVGDVSGAGRVLVFGGEETPLPVELTHLSAQGNGADVVLAWETASETNNAGFEVQHADAGGWQRVAFVDGGGTTAEARSYAYRLSGLGPGAHRFRLKQVDFDGSFAYSPVAEVDVEAPTEFALAANYPNPFNPATVIRYTLPRDAHVTLAVYDVLGRRVRTLVDAPRAAGSHAVSFDAGTLAGGVYLYRIEAGSYSATRRMTLAK